MKTLPIVLNNGEVFTITGETKLIELVNILGKAQARIALELYLAL